jgi:hypothetical protein
MKHLLILLISILLSFPLFGQETGVLYQYETSTGIKWKTFGNEKVQPKYEGEIKNGDMWFILHGLGVITFPYDGKSIIGEWKEGKEWNTKHTKKDGTFIGKFENGEWIEGETLYGWGKYPEIVWKGFGDKETHSKYEGDVENGKPNGVGILISPMGGKYVGSWKNGVRNGKGTTTYSSGTKYEGGWKDGGMWNGTLYDTNGKILHKIVNGEIQSP